MRRLKLKGQTWNVNFYDRGEVSRITFKVKRDIDATVGEPFECEIVEVELRVVER